MRDLTVTLIQEATIWHDAAANRALYENRVMQSASSDLIVLPETFLSGFSNDAIDYAQDMQGDNITWLRHLAREKNSVIAGSLLIKVGATVFNRLVWMRPDGQCDVYDKRHLFRMAKEHERYGAGDSKLIVELNGWHICPLVCYDLRFPVWARNQLRGNATDQLDYDLLLFVANWPSARRHAWQTLLRARAIENLSYCIGVNRVGIDGNQLHYAGDSVALDFLGAPLVECGGEPMIVTVKLSAENLFSHRQKFPAYLDADEFTLKI
jgi:omega-amidase